MSILTKDDNNRSHWDQDCQAVDCNVLIMSVLVSVTTIVACEKKT